MTSSIISTTVAERELSTPCKPIAEPTEITDEMNYWLSCADQLPLATRAKFRERVQAYATDAYARISVMVASGQRSSIDLKNELKAASVELRVRSQQFFEIARSYENSKADQSQRFKTMHDKIVEKGKGLPPIKEFIQQWSESTRKPEQTHTWSDVASAVCDFHPATRSICDTTKGLFKEKPETQYQFPPEQELQRCMDEKRHLNFPQGLRDKAVVELGGEKVTQTELEKKVNELQGSSSYFLNTFQRYSLEKELESCATKN